MTGVEFSILNADLLSASMVVGLSGGLLVALVRPIAIWVRMVLH